MSPVVVTITGGGTGGHVYPALAVVAALTALTAERLVGRPAFHYIGTRGGMEEGIIARTSIPFHGISAGALRGRAIPETAINLGRMVQGYAQARRILADAHAGVVLATGGYVCVPVVVAATSLRIPVVIYLPDVTPGWAIRSLTPFATAIAVTNEEAATCFPERKVRITGYPVRDDIVTSSREAACARLGLRSDLPVVLATGGSRGARSINLAIARGLPRLLPLCQVVHVTGDITAEETARAATVPPDLAERYRPFPYLHDDYAAALVAASLVVCRSGASVLGELPATGLPSVLVPYPHAGAHQQANARALAAAGAAEILHDNEVEARLVDRVVDLLSTPERLGAMREAARKLDRPGGARAIAEVLLDQAIRSERLAA